jgi:peptidoglycan/LPS O-acetylase OafA/YrhL
MSNSNNRMPLIDALKALAAMLVLLNHFSSYGPLAATVREAFPGVFGWSGSVTCVCRFPIWRRLVWRLQRRRLLITGWMTRRFLPVPA